MWPGNALDRAATLILECQAETELFWQKYKSYINSEYIFDIVVGILTFIMNYKAEDGLLHGYHRSCWSLHIFFG